METTARHRTERCLAAIAAPDGEGKLTFTQVYSSSALQEAAAADERRRRGTMRSPLDGCVVAVKDLFDVAGQTTWAGSVALRDAPAATADAPAVTNLRRAGCIIVGKTNMTEFAYSGVGLNPHFGTPANPFERKSLRRIPGGSSSGAAIAVTDGMAAVGLGTDTGGSVRIPAALCGIAGWKPTARRISLTGVWPLAPNFDSVGVMAERLDTCIDADAVLTGTAAPRNTLPLKGLRLARLRAYTDSGLDAEVERAYEAALKRLTEAGVQIVDVSIPELERIPREQAGITMPTYEAFHVHEKMLQPLAALYDPRIRQRLEQGRDISAERYAAAAQVRVEVQQVAEQSLSSFDAFLLPTVAVIAPPFEAFDTDEHYLAINRKVLRNTSLLNFLDGCAVTLPCQDAGTAPVGLSIAGMSMRDTHVLAVARALEPVVVFPPRLD